MVDFFSYGDILPHTSEEKWVATVCMLWGVVLFGYILGDLASLLTNADAQRSRYIHRLNTIREHLKEARVSELLKKKVLGYYEYLVYYFDNLTTAQGVIRRNHVSYSGKGIKARP